MKNVLVKHAVRKGEVVNSKGLVQEIVHFYIGGKVRTSSGDVWDVKRVTHSKYEYVSVAAVGR